VRRLLLAGFLLSAWSFGSAPAQAGAATNELTIVHWNVENLFDADDDPNSKGDDPFTPRGWEHWTEGRYREKLAHLADFLNRMHGDIVSLAEVENRRVLDDLNAALQKKHGWSYPYIIHREGGDHRGIDTAVLATIPPSTNWWLTPVKEQRDIIVAQFAQGGRKLSVLSNHWKSRLGSKKESDGIRNTEAVAARAEVLRIIKADPGAAVLVLGDFNDDFDGSALVEQAGCLTDKAKVLADATGASLFNLHALLKPEERGTIYYHPGGTWNTFDSINVSRSMLLSNTAGWKVKEGSYSVARFPEQVDQDGHPLPFRRVNDRSKADRDYEYGYSDHYPVKLTLVQRP
jgi:endonuclease/exonuclease/phosphatase family metal-dependent hydrolase